MRSLIYWIADRVDDSAAYSIREKTRKAVLSALDAKGAKLADDGEFKTPSGLTWDTPRQITVHYTDALDLLKQALAEGGCER